MKTRQLGNTSFQISAIGFGSWALGGGKWQFSWGEQDDADSVAAIHRAIDLGVNWIDTAAGYGLGHSEEIVARALRGIPPSRRPYVFTKCSMVWDESGVISHNLSPASLRREAEDSLRRLKMDAIDLYQIHWPALPPEEAGGPAPGIEEAWSTLADLRKQGKVRFIGVSNFSVPQLERIARIAPVSSLQPPYSLIRREIEAEILPYCERHNIGVIVYSPMQNGLLSGKMTRERIAALPGDDWRKTRNPDFQEPKLAQNLRLVEKLRAIGQRHGRTPAQLAIAWTVRHPAVTGAIVGARRPEQVNEIAGAADFRFSESELEEIDRALSALAAAS
jgi:aryl-alcohol dehydrogenase-like predicted oxidoreductase